LQWGLTSVFVFTLKGALRQQVAFMKNTAVNCGYVEWGNVWRIVVGFSWMNEDERFKREWKKARVARVAHGNTFDSLSKCIYDSLKLPKYSRTSIILNLSE
jgi:hypothetical protein